jgi:MFS family permease
VARKLIIHPPITAQIIFEIPSNIGIRKYGAALWLSSACMAWGVIQVSHSQACSCSINHSPLHPSAPAQIGQGFVQSAATLTVTRTLMGLFEAALFPGAAYLLACWNVRSEVQRAMSLFYALSILISGLSAILAYGLSQMQGVGDLSGW